MRRGDVPLLTVVVTVAVLTAQHLKAGLVNRVALGRAKLVVTQASPLRHLLGGQRQILVPDLQRLAVQLYLGTHGAVTRSS